MSAVAGQAATECVTGREMEMETLVQPPQLSDGAGH